MAILGLIPARGGSKGIPRKNVRPIAGKPLIGWTIDAALTVAELDRVVVTTDDPEIAAAARTHGADLPFVRPANLACDETPGIDPVLHALDLLPGYDTVVLLQPTSPLRTPDDIRAAIAMYAEASGTNVVSVTEAKHAAWTFPIDNASRLELATGVIAARRQEAQRQVTLNGAIYVAQINRLRLHRSFLVPGTLGYAMSAEHSVDIDTSFDWRIAEMLLRERM